MKKCYLIIEDCGDLPGSYPIKVFLSRDNAENFIKNNSSPITEDQLSISQEAYQMALEIAWNDFPEDRTTSFPELIVGTKKFPEWSLKELRVTEEYIRRSEIGWIGYRIEELELCQ